MGNCQAIDATIVIQYPCGRVEKLYWPVTASEVMKTNPGHHVALLLTTTTFRPSTTTTTTTTNHHQNNPVRITRIKLLRPTDILILGQAYRLITAEEVMKGLWEKKCAKMKRQSKSADQEKEERTKEKLGSDFEAQPRRSNTEKTNRVGKHDGHRPRTTTPANSSAAVTPKSKAWQPSLQSISEAGS